MRRIFVALFTGAVLAVAPPYIRARGANPSGTGQPGAECGEPGGRPQNRLASSRVGSRTPRLSTQGARAHPLAFTIADQAAA
jgi:hypothetical protein